MTDTTSNAGSTPASSTQINDWEQQARNVDRSREGRDRPVYPDNVPANGEGGIVQVANTETPALPRTVADGSRQNNAVAQANDDILTKADIKAIDGALIYAYKPHLLESERAKEAQRAKATPPGTHGSTRIYDKADGDEAELAIADRLKVNQRGMTPEAIAAVKELTDSTIKLSPLAEKVGASATVFDLERRVKGEGPNIKPEDQVALNAARKQYEAVDARVSALEDQTPAAAAFRAARKIQKNGRDNS